MTESKRRACEWFLRPIEARDYLNDAPEDVSITEQNEFNPPVKNGKIKRLRTSSKYVDTRFASGTSNLARIIPFKCVCVLHLNGPPFKGHINGFKSILIECDKNYIRHVN